MSYGKSRKNGKIVKYTMSRGEAFSDEENEKFLNKPIKLIQAFLEKQKSQEK